jgi:hypothetical protein
MSDQSSQTADTPFGEVRRNIPSRDDHDHSACLMSMRGRVPVTVLLAHLEKVAPGIPLDKIGINFGTVTWLDDATEQEKHDRAEHQRTWEARHAQWEREIYAKLRAKFEPGHDEQTDGPGRADGADGAVGAR